MFSLRSLGWGKRQGAAKTFCNLEGKYFSIFGFYNDEDKSKFWRFRDFAFFTSFKSKKYCDRIDLPTKVTTQTDAGLQWKLEFGFSPAEAREYVETNDSEMDIWLSISPSESDSLLWKRQVRLVVTPVKKRCSKGSSWWWPCQGWRQHFCNSIVVS